MEVVADRQESADSQQQQQQQQQRKPFQVLGLGGDPKQPQQQQQPQTMQKQRGAPSPSPRRKSPARKKARTSLENDLGEANRSGEIEGSVPAPATPEDNPDAKKLQKGGKSRGELIEFSPDSQGSGPALRFSDGEDDEDEEEDGDHVNEENHAGNPAHMDQNESVSNDEDDDEDDDEGDMDTSLEDNFVNASAASTPSIPEVELNTRRNALRPVHSHRKSIASSGTANSSEMEDSDDDFEGNDEANRTVTLADFQNLLAAGDGDDDDDDDDDDDGQQQNSTPRPRKKASEQTTSSDDDDDDDAIPRKRNERRRNTASPSALQELLEMADSDDDDDDEDELEAARGRGRREAEMLAKDDDKLFAVSTPEDNKLSSARAKQDQEEDITPVAFRTRSSAKKQRRPGTEGAAAMSAAGAAAGSAELGPLPTPLKSCISARKKRGTSTKKKKSVVFGSPDAAEFDYQDPVRGGVTPLAKNYARTRYKMEDRVDSDDDDLIEEDRETALNSSILATWEEEEDEDMDEDEDSDAAQARLDHSLQSINSRRSRGSRRSSMGIFRAGARSDRPPASPSVRSEDDKSELEQKFDEVATDSGKPPPPSPATAEEVIRNGRATAMRQATPAKAAAPSPATPASQTRSQGDTIDFRELDELAASTPGSEENAGNRTIDLDELMDVMDDTHSSGGSSRRRRSSRRQSRASTGSANSASSSLGNRTVDLDDLAALSPVVSSPGARRRSQGASASRGGAADDDSHEEEEERTVELGQLSDLAALDESVDSRADGDVSMADDRSSPGKGERTVELGNLAQLAAMSPESTSGANSAKGMSPAAEEHTVELGTLTDLAAMSPEEAPALRRSQRRASLGSALSAQSAKSKRSGAQRGTPQERTVDLGSLSELAAMTPESEPRSSTKPGPAPLTDERTKELGSLAELADFTPGSKAASAVKPVAEAPNSAQKTAASPHMRLSFSSLGSSSQGSEEKGKRSESQTLQFDSAAVLDGFMNSPGSTTSARTPESGPRSRRTASSEVKTSTPSAPGSESAATPHSAQTPSSEARSSTGMELTPDNHASSPADAANEQASTDAFRPRRALARTPLSQGGDGESEDAEIHDAEESAAQEQALGDSLTTDAADAAEPAEPSQKALGLAEFLAQCDTSLSDDVMYQDLGDAEDPSQELVDDPQVEAQEVEGAELTRACILQAEMFGQKWSVNESRNRALLAQQTIQELVTAFEQSSPSLLMVDAQDGEVDARIKSAIALLRAQALCEARASWSDIEAKGLTLSLQALEEQGAILQEDIGIVREGVGRLEAALEQSKGAVASAERRSSLLEALLEQREVIGGYRGEIGDLEGRVQAADKALSSVQSAHDKQAARLREAQDSFEMLEAQKQAEVDYESQNAVLDVAQGLHCWRLHHANATTVQLAFDHVDGSCGLVSIIFDLQPSVCEVRVQHLASESPVPEDVESAQGTGVGEVEAQMAKITSARLERAVAALRSRLRGAAPSSVSDALLELDVEFGRLGDLWEELLQICQSESYPCRLAARADGSMVFSAEIYYGDVGGIVKVNFEILPSYPLESDACKVTFELVSDRNHDQLLQHLEQAVLQRKSDVAYFAPLSALWAGILEIF